MKRGRIRLLSGLTINCAYELVSEEEGRLDLFPAFLGELEAGQAATLIPGEGREWAIVVRALDREHATFQIVERSLKRR